MCQLLGMNCATPTDFSFSFRGFVKRGGETDVHSHGWGMIVYQGNKGAIRCFHDTLPACKSPIAELVQQYPIQSLNMMAHVRYATQGDISLENVHPFSRVWKGIQMTFCHNGDCPHFGTIVPPPPPPSSASCDSIADVSVTPILPLLGRTTTKDIIYHPVGDTDSEAVFCAILNALHVEFPDGLPTLSILHEFISILCNEIISYNPGSTIFNFLLGCGQHTMFAYSYPGKRPKSTVWNGLYYIIREPPFKSAKLLDVDYEIDFDKVTTMNDRVAVIATKPLTQEDGWTEFRKNELIMFNRGIPYRCSTTCSIPENNGCGLSSKLMHTIPKCCNLSPKMQSMNCNSSTTSKATRTTTSSSCDSSSTSSSLDKTFILDDDHDTTDDDDNTPTLMKHPQTSSLTSTSAATTPPTHIVNSFLDTTSTSTTTTTTDTSATTIDNSNTAQSSSSLSPTIVTAMSSVNGLENSIPQQLKV